MNKFKKKSITLHPKNKHKGHYNFDVLTNAHPTLKRFVKLNKFGNVTIDFSDPEAVKMLNTALLKHHYKLNYWDIPANYLCPPIPGRADYIHHIAQLLGNKNQYKIPMNSKVTCIDIGTGANCIYPIIGHQEYGWKFIGTDIDKKALESAKEIVTQNKFLTDKIDFRFQKNSSHIFKGIIKSNDIIDLTICNPPFHSSAQEAKNSAKRKINNLTKEKNKAVKLNFGGVSNELWCEGGEKQFIQKMISESALFGKQCYWFSTLVSKKENLNSIYALLKQKKAVQIKTINMGQGNKISRIVAWTFLTEPEQENWMHNKWRSWNKI